MGNKIGPKEAALKSQREENLDLPDFLKRSETPEQAEARRKKHKPRDSTGGMKVIEPTIMPEKIRKAIEKDLRDEPELPKTISPQQLAEVINDAMPKAKAKRPRAHAALADLPNTLGPAIREASADAKKKKAKKLSPVLAKALAEKEKLNQLATKATSVENTVKKASKATAKQSKKTKSNSVSKPKSNGAAAKAFTDENVKTAAALIKRKGGALSSELQKACHWQPIMVRRFVRDIARKKLDMSVICDRSSGRDSTYRLR